MKKIVTCLFCSALLFILSANLQAQSDPASIDVYTASSAITLDGQLNEEAWSVDAPHLIFKVNGSGSGNGYAPTNEGLVVKGDYRDTSTTLVKFLVSGMDLYVSLESDDEQVCKFDWEGDGLFMIFKNNANQNCELKLYVINTTTFGAEGGGSTPVDGYAGTGVVDGTIFDSSDVDGGYTAEGVIHLDKLGFTTLPETLLVSVVIFDPDHYSTPGNPWGTNGNFAKQWWGSEWGSEFRVLKLHDTVLPVELSSFTASASAEGVRLSWITSSEKNNLGFEVERSLDNRSFEKIGFVAGNGTTTDKKVYSFVDKNILGKVFYRLKQIDYDGKFEYSASVEVNSALLKYDLSQNYPNPFNPTTTIKFALPEKNFVTLKVYDLLGNEIKTLVNEEKEAGQHEINFNASNLSSGVYYYTISSGSFSATKKFILMK